LPTTPLANAGSNRNLSVGAVKAMVLQTVAFRFQG
jgi:hypothetical protein